MIIALTCCIKHMLGVLFTASYNSVPDCQTACRVVIDESFAIRDIVFSMKHIHRYYVLVLSEQPTRLYDGFRDSLSEVEDYGFPFTHEGPGGATKLPGGVGVNP